MGQNFEINNGFLRAYTGSSEVVIIPEEVTSIGRFAFSKCKRLKKVVLPDCLVTIERNAFSRCEHIDEVLIQGNPKIENRAFEDCGVEQFLVENSTKYISEDGLVYNMKKTKLILFPAHKNVIEYSIPEGVTSVAPYLLYGPNIYVLLVILPKSLTKVPKNTFSFWSNDRPEDSTDIYKKYYSWQWVKDEGVMCWLNGHVAYYNPELAASLGNGIYLGGPLDDLADEQKQDAVRGFLYALQIGIKEVEPYKDGYYQYIKKHNKWFVDVGNQFSFNLMLQEKLITAKTIEKLVDHPYMKDNPKVMEAVLSYKNGFSDKELSAASSKPKKESAKEKQKKLIDKRREEIKNQIGIKDVVFVAVGDDLKNFVCRDETTGERDWSELKEFIEDRDGILRHTVSTKTDYLICNDLDCEDKKVINAKELGVPIISEIEFLELANQSDVHIDAPEEFVIIHSNGKLKAYTGQDKKVVIPKGVKTIGDGVFSGVPREQRRFCESLEEVIIPEGVTDIGRNAFTWCHHLEKVSFPEGLETIGMGAFSRCEALEEIILPSSLRVIENGAFEYCGSLKKIHICDTVENVGKVAFAQAYESSSANWYADREINITVECVSNNESNQKQIMIALGSSLLAYSLLSKRLTASDGFIQLIIKWLSTKSNRKKIIEAAIERNNQQAIAELKKYGIKISKNEITEYIELATNQKHTEIVALLLNY